MGVLACDRSRCENIMCGRYSSNYGYICGSCFDELVRLGPEQNVQEFMDSDQGCNPPLEAIEAFFNHIFVSRKEDDESISDW